MTEGWRQLAGSGERPTVLLDRLLVLQALADR
jgi:hypothetical protein